MDNINNKTSLSLTEAYSAMYKFLENEYAMTGSSDVGGMLGSMSLLEDGSTADPAAWDDWIQSVDRVINKGDDDIDLHIRD